MEHINVKDFGAKMDGVTDDTRVFQAAIDFAVNQGAKVLKEFSERYYPKGEVAMTQEMLVALHLKRFLEALEYAAETIHGEFCSYKCSEVHLKLLKILGGKK